MSYFGKSIAVLGGGITGLTAAYRLTAQGHRARVFEAGDRIGGAIRTELSDGWLVEAGPNSLREESREVETLLHELGLGPERIESNPAAKNRYLVRNGRPVPVPMSPGGFLSTPLLTAGAKLRIVCELFSRARTRDGDVSLAEFVRDHFGSEVLDRVVQPIVGGIWAGDVSMISVQASFPKLLEIERRHGSLLRGMIAGAKARKAEGLKSPKTISFRRGLQTLSWALTARLPDGGVVLNARVDSLRKDGRWQVRWQQGATTYCESFDAVIAPLPAGSLARMEIGAPGEHPLACLSEIGHAAISSLFLGFKREQVAHPLDGFGLLVPETEKRSILGVLFSSSLFAGRAPDGCVGLTVLAGGAHHPDIAGLPLPALLERVSVDLRDLLGVTGSPIFVRHAYWPRAIPQYHLGHQRYRDAVAACEKANPGLHIGGQSVDGVSLSDCISNGYKLAEQAVLHP